MRKTLCIHIVFLLICTFSGIILCAQQITGVWKGRIDHKNVEVKIIQNGDSLTGVSYYHQPGGGYKRYSIKGYFDPQDNSVVWWDDQLLKESNRLFGTGAAPLLSVADFNCPGGNKMMLEGKAASKEMPQKTKGPVNLTKTGRTSYPDEWDNVIDNYVNGTHDPYLIDSVALIARVPQEQKKEPQRPSDRSNLPEPVLPPQKPGMAVIPAPPAARKEPSVTKPLTIEEKYTIRKKVFTAEIPVSGETIELRFYDNAEIDGDSISLFLNDVLIFRHIRLTAQAYSVKLPVNDLKETNELTMVAENLGAIPPNTSLMVALVGDKRYEARLASTENSSAVIRLKKVQP